MFLHWQIFVRSFACGSSVLVVCAATVPRCACVRVMHSAVHMNECMQFLPFLPQQLGVELNGTPQLTLDSLFVQIANGSTGQALQSALFPRVQMPDISLGGSTSADMGNGKSALDILKELP
jgi:hypothetical protein